MQSLRYHESMQRGSPDFPLAYYCVEKTHARYEMPYHWHEETEILYVRSGRFELSLDGESIPLSPGDAAYIAAGRLHGGMPHECVYECAVFDLRMLLSAPALCKELLGRVESGKIALRALFPGGNAASAALPRLFTALREGAPGYALAALGSLYAFFGDVYREKAYAGCGEHPAGGKRMLRLKQVFDLIESSYASPLRLSDLAAAVPVDRKYFCRFFKQATHLTPMQYLQYYRIERACYEMQSTDKNVTEIALDVGFASPEYFTRVFKKHKGIAPGQYLSRLRSEG